MFSLSCRSLSLHHNICVSCSISTPAQATPPLLARVLLVLQQTRRGTGNPKKNKVYPCVRGESGTCDSAASNKSAVPSHGPDTRGWGVEEPRQEKHKCSVPADRPKGWREIRGPDGKRITRFPPTIPNSTPIAATKHVHPFDPSCVMVQPFRDDPPANICTGTSCHRAANRNTGPDRGHPRSLLCNTSLSSLWIPRPRPQAQRRTAPRSPPVRRFPRCRSATPVTPHVRPRRAQRTSAA